MVPAPPLGVPKPDLANQAVLLLAQVEFNRTANAVSSKILHKDRKAFLYALRPTADGPERVIDSPGPSFQSNLFFHYIQHMGKSVFFTCTKNGCGYHALKCAKSLWYMF
jgi:hypothetical protein